jgi:hypothetical protein
MKDSFTAPDEFLHRNEPTYLPRGDMHILARQRGDFPNPFIPGHEMQPEPAVGHTGVAEPG